MKRVWTAGILIACLTTAPGGVDLAAAQAKKKGPAAGTPPPPAAVVPPEVVLAGIRVTGPGYGGNRKELQPFNSEPGIAISLAIKMPPGTTLIKLDEDDCKLTSMTDDTGADLHDIRFLDATGNALVAHRTERSSIGEAATHVYVIESATKPAAFEFMVWQTPKQQELPYKVKANLSLR